MKNKVMNFKRFVNESRNEGMFKTTSQGYGDGGWGAVSTLHTIAIQLKIALEKGEIDKSQHDSVLDLLNMESVPDDTNFARVLGKGEPRITNIKQEFRDWE